MLACLAQDTFQILLRVGISKLMHIYEAWINYPFQI